MSESTVVVVPLYKSDTNELEKISITQMLKKLNRYKKFFLVPQSMKNIDLSLDRTCEIKRYPDEYFISSVSYSRLLLSPGFYKEFGEYQYILIHQLDAFVFSDTLKEFCSMGYDYIGAPWYRSSGAYKFVKGYVGNGGLSLRHVINTIKVLEKNMDLIKRKFLCNLMKIGEDMIFSYLGNNSEYNIAPAKIAKKFSLECDFHKGYSNLNEERPFGCHHWWNGDFDVWRRYVTDEGYNLKSDYDYAVKGFSKRKRIDGVVKYLVYRVMKWGDKIKIKNLLSKCVALDKPIVIWGMGVVGRRCFDFLKFLDVPIECIIEKNTKNIMLDDVAICSKPNETMLSDCKIMIATSRYYTEIAIALTDMGLRKNEMFYDYNLIERSIVFEYYEDMWNFIKKKDN